MRTERWTVSPPEDWQSVRTVWDRRKDAEDREGHGRNHRDAVRIGVDAERMADVISRGRFMHGVGVSGTVRK